MTLRDDPEFLDYREQAMDAIEEHEGAIFLYEGTFVKTQNGKDRPYACRFSLKDPNKGGPAQVAAAQAFARGQEADYVDVRLMRVHPDDTRPPTGSVLAVPWDGGRLEIRSWAQPSAYSRLAVGYCLLRR